MNKPDYDSKAFIDDNVMKDDPLLCLMNEYIDIWEHFLCSILKNPPYNDK